MAERKPRAEKTLKGTLRADRDKVPVELPEIEPLMPRHLPERAQQIWRAKAPGLVEAGLLTSQDSETFGLYCALSAAIESAYADGNLPSRDLMSAFRPLASAFGLNPDARHRLGVPREKPTNQKRRGFNLDD